MSRVSHVGFLVESFTLCYVFFPCAWLQGRAAGAEEHHNKWFLWAIFSHLVDAGG